MPFDSGIKKYHLFHTNNIKLIRTGFCLITLNGSDHLHNISFRGDLMKVKGICEIILDSTFDPVICRHQILRV